MDLPLLSVTFPARARRCWLVSTTWSACVSKTPVETPNTLRHPPPAEPILDSLDGHRSTLLVKRRRSLPACYPHPIPETKAVCFENLEGNCSICMTFKSLNVCRSSPFTGKIFLAQTLADLLNRWLISAAVR
ncbi:unnamed protein product [Ectocarpus fasciculatus]